MSGLGVGFAMLPFKTPAASRLGRVYHAGLECRPTLTEAQAPVILPVAGAAVAVSMARMRAASSVQGRLAYVKTLAPCFGNRHMIAGKELSYSGGLNRSSGIAERFHHLDEAEAR
jgi:hypothetical protein